MGPKWIKKRWDYKYPSLLSFMTEEVTKGKEEGKFLDFPSPSLRENT